MRIQSKNNNNIKEKPNRYFTIAFTLLIGIFSNQISVSAQNIIEGTIISKSKKEEPIPFGHVLILNSVDSSLVQGTVSDENGKFKLVGLKKGNHLLHVKAIGFKSVYYPIAMSHSDGYQNVMKISLEENLQQLEEVNVQAGRVLQTKEADRQLINVANSVTAPGQNALEVIQKSPGVRVDQQTGTLSIYGKSGVSVMINNRIINMPQESVLQMLEGMNASKIDKIELITSPSAKQDAGKSGIIHILLKEKTELGTNGDAGIRAGYFNGPLIGGNAGISKRWQETDLFFDYSFQFDKKDEVLSLTRVDATNSDHTSGYTNNRDRKIHYHNFRTGINHNFNSKLSTNIMLSGYRRNFRMDALTINEVRAPSESLLRSELTVNEKNTWQNLNGTLGLEYRPDSSQSFTVTADILYYHNDNPSNYNNPAGFDIQDEFQYRRVSKVTPIWFKVFGVDYEKELAGNLVFQAGVKSTDLSFKNEVEVQDFNTSWQTDPVFSNQAEVDESISAGYILFDFNAEGLFHLTSGIRYEHTITDLTSNDPNGQINRNYGQWFPSLSISTGISESKSISLVYNKSIARPTLNDMAPFVFFLGTDTFLSGNTNLLPGITNNIDLTLKQNERWVSFKFFHAKNDIKPWQPEIVPQSNELIFKAQNLNYSSGLTANFSIPFHLRNWWDIRLDMQVGRQWMSTNYENQEVRKSLNTGSGTVTSTMLLPKDLAFELTGSYFYKSLSGLNTMLPTGRIDAGFRKKLNNEKGNLFLNFSDILHTSLYRMEYDISGIESQSEGYFDGNYQIVTLTYSRNFGNKKLRNVEKRSGASEGRNRVN